MEYPHIVVGCSTEAASEIDKLAKEVGARGATDLGTAGAFHTSFMQEPTNKLDEKLSKYQFKNPEVPVVANLTGEATRSGSGLRNHLVESMVNPVQWAKTLANLQSSRVVVFGEVGPGTSLAALNRINGIPENQTINVLKMI